MQHASHGRSGTGADIRRRACKRLLQADELITADAVLAIPCATNLTLTWMTTTRHVIGDDSGKQLPDARQKCNGQG